MSTGENDNLLKVIRGSKATDGEQVVTWWEARRGVKVWQQDRKTLVRLIDNALEEVRTENQLAENVFKFILPNHPFATITELAKPALDAVDTLRAQLSTSQRCHADAEEDLASARLRIDELRERARELAMVVQVGTGDDPGEVLQRLRKIESDAATRMRDACMKLIRQVAAGEMNGHASGGMFKAATVIESLTLEAARKQETKEEILARRRALMPDYDKKLEDWLS